MKYINKRETLIFIIIVELSVLTILNSIFIVVISRENLRIADSTLRLAQADDSFMKLQNRGDNLRDTFLYNLNDRVKKLEAK